MGKKSRRDFIKKTAYACASFPFVTQMANLTNKDPIGASTIKMDNDKNKSIIGAYGEWASSMLNKVPDLSYRQEKWKATDSWKKAALKKTMELVAPPKIDLTSEVTVHKQYVYDGLSIEELSWQLSNGNGPTQAILLKPLGAKGKLPAILGLHDHGGNKYFGKRKITKVTDHSHPLIDSHQKEYYGSLAWANELAKRGYVVLVHDAFAFGSRRVFLDDVEGISWGGAYLDGISDVNPEAEKNIETYNNWASNHEHVLSKSLFCSGTTWPGVVFSEDRVALNILCEREEVDSDNIGCAGLSGGGLRTNYLAGLDHRVKCAVSVGFMSTWKDFLLHKAFTHTWMLYVPLLPKFLEYPEILGLRVPLPTLVLNNNQDQLYTLSEMKSADKILSQVYDKAGASEKYKTIFYEGLHKFDREMQSDAFDWFDKWLHT